MAFLDLWSYTALAFCCLWQSWSNQWNWFKCSYATLMCSRPECHCGKLTVHLAATLLHLPAPLLCWTGEMKGVSRFDYVRKRLLRASRQTHWEFVSDSHETQQIWSYTPYYSKQRFRNLGTNLVYLAACIEKVPVYKSVAYMFVRHTVRLTDSSQPLFTAELSLWYHIFSSQAFVLMSLKYFDVPYESLLALCTQACT